MDEGTKQLMKLFDKYIDNVQETLWLEVLDKQKVDRLEQITDDTIIALTKLKFKLGK